MTGCFTYVEASPLPHVARGPWPASCGHRWLWSPEECASGPTPVSPWLGSPQPGSSRPLPAASAWDPHRAPFWPASSPPSQCSVLQVLLRSAVRWAQEPGSGTGLTGRPTTGAEGCLWGRAAAHAGRAAENVPGLRAEDTAVQNEQPSVTTSSGMFISSEPESPLASYFLGGRDMGPRSQPSAPKKESEGHQSRRPAPEESPEASCLGHVPKGLSPAVTGHHLQISCARGSLCELVNSCRTANQPKTWRPRQPASSRICGWGPECPLGQGCVTLVSPELELISGSLSGCRRNSGPRQDAAPAVAPRGPLRGDCGRLLGEQGRSGGGGMGRKFVTSLVELAVPSAGLERA